jgi:hypothetical protein
MRHPYRVQVLDTDLSPVYRARRDQRVAMLVLRIAVRVGAVSYPPPEWGTDRTKTARRRPPLSRSSMLLPRPLPAAPNALCEKRALTRARWIAFAGITGDRKSGVWPTASIAGNSGPNSFLRQGVIPVRAKVA